jgi:hypothetical protein
LLDVDLLKLALVFRSTRDDGFALLLCRANRLFFSVSPAR